MAGPEAKSCRDSWKPKVFGGSPSDVASINHGTYFYHAAMEGLLKNDTNIHAGIRTTLSGPSDYENDGYCGFEIVEAREIDTIGMYMSVPFVSAEMRLLTYQEPMASSKKSGTALAPRTRCISRLTSTPWILPVSPKPPLFPYHRYSCAEVMTRLVAPGTGTPETGGWTTRELRTIVRGLDGLNLIGADIVEVSPAYDTNAELSTMYVLCCEDGLDEMMLTGVVD